MIVVQQNIAHYLRRTLALPVFVATTVLLSLSLSMDVQAAGSGGGSMSGGTPAPAKQRTPDELAESAYKRGIKHNERGRSLEQKARDEDNDKKVARHLKKAKSSYNKAVKELGKVLAIKPNDYKALNELGFALRKTGEFSASIAAYNKALKIKDDFAPAVEYRAEALLALGEFEHVKRHYMWLVENDKAHASMLMTALNRWADERSSDDEAADAFAQWVSERSDLSAIMLESNTSIW